MFGMQGDMGEQTLQDSPGHWHEDIEILPVRPQRVHWLQLVVLFLASLKRRKGICFEGIFLHLFKVVRGFQSGR